MCFARKASLGHYNGTRAEWRAAYRAARIAEREGLEPGLIVAYDRAEYNDQLTRPLSSRLEAKRIIDEILSN